VGTLQVVLGLRQVTAQDGQIGTVPVSTPTAAARLACFIPALSRAVAILAPMNLLNSGSRRFGLGMPFSC
jgi:hypothetical protein